MNSIRKMKIDLTIICVYNNKQLLEKQLLESLCMQNVEVETVLIDNQNHQFSSAAKALNYGASLAKGKYLLFVHQDIIFRKNDVVYKIYQFLEDHQQAIIGAAGIKIGEKGLYSHIVHGHEQIVVGEKDIARATKVDVLDECVMGVQKEQFLTNKFDEKICDGWDLYVVDVCLNAMVKKRDVFVLPMDIWHVSPGNPKHAFYKCARRLYKKYRNQIKRIQTCCITVPVPTNVLSFPLLSALEILHVIRK